VYFSIGIMMMVLLLGGAVQLVAVFIGRARLEVVKDIKGLELRLLELESLIRDRNRYIPPAKGGSDADSG
jgi:hypothetical protein